MALSTEHFQIPRTFAGRLNIAPFFPVPRICSTTAAAELGKAIKTLFLCRYLHEETLRREIHEGLNVIEQWNGANDFVFFARCAMKLSLLIFGYSRLGETSKSISRGAACSTATATALRQ